MDERSSPSLRGNQAIFLFLAGLTGPFIVLAAPLWIYRFWIARREQSGFGLLLVVIAIVTSGAQIFNLVTTAPPNAQLLESAGALISLIAKWLAGPFGSNSVVLSLALGGLLIASLSGGNYYRERIGFVLYAAIILAATASKFGDRAIIIRAQGGGERYLYVPLVMYAFCMITLFFERWSLARWLVPPAAVVLAGMIVTSAQTALYKRVPEDATAQWQRLAPEIGHKELVITAPPNWKTKIPAVYAPTQP